jgi:3-phenylpropionate/cinnamic acid dioxygenase small subunit
MIPRDQRARVEDFLYAEAGSLDDWMLGAWLARLCEAPVLVLAVDNTGRAEGADSAFWMEWDAPVGHGAETSS